MLFLYQHAIRFAEPLFDALLQRRIDRGKEDQERLPERFGIPSIIRPEGTLIWFHAASVGESQSALSLIERLLDKNPQLHILITTGTVTSARLMKDKLPERAFHQFYPLDHPDYVVKFLNHWKPDAALWLESELWPNMMLQLKKQNIPSILLNARMSEKSYKAWRFFRGTSKKLLTTFKTILAQTDKDAQRYQELGAQNIHVTGNIKFSARSLPCASNDLSLLSAHTMNRQSWVYASTHKGEEDLACAAHTILKNRIPDLLTIIVPRHPDRRDEIKAICETHDLNTIFRGENKSLPAHDTDIYIADTMGELGLFYRLCDIAVVGRSFSDDGGGGHNPIEPAQLSCAVLHGPNVQYQQHIFDDMNIHGAATMIHEKHKLTDMLHDFLSNPEKLEAAKQNAQKYVAHKGNILDTVLEYIAPFIPKI